MVDSENRTRSLWLPNRGDTHIYVVQAANDSAGMKLRAGSEKKEKTPTTVLIIFLSTTYFDGKQRLKKAVTISNILFGKIIRKFGEKWQYSAAVKNLQYCINLVDSCKLL